MEQKLIRKNVALFQVLEYCFNFKPRKHLDIMINRKLTCGPKLWNDLNKALENIEPSRKITSKLEHG